MKIFNIIKDNNLAKFVFVIISLVVIFHQVIYHIISEKFFKNTNNTSDTSNRNNTNNTNNTNDENYIKESFTNLDEKTELFMDSNFKKNMKVNHEKDISNKYPNLDLKRANTFLDENKFLSEDHVIQYESCKSCLNNVCMTPQQKYYLQYVNKN